MISAYPKVWNIGHKAIEDLFNEPVLVQEKVDGSQFSFMRSSATNMISMRSHHCEVFAGSNEGMFALACATVLDLAEGPGLTPELIYRAEFLAKPHHNALVYARVPRMNLILFDIQEAKETSRYLSADAVREEAERLGLECVPHHGLQRVQSLGELKQWVAEPSCLGGGRREGIVCKNYERFGLDGHPLFGKYVDESFKEVARASWGRQNPGRQDILATIITRFGTSRRWEKAVEALRDAGTLQEEVQDIGPLIHQVQMDIEEECIAEIAEALYLHFKGDILRGVIRGLPQWYKDRLAAIAFKDGE